MRCFLEGGKSRNQEVDSSVEMEKQKLEQLNNFKK